MNVFQFVGVDISKDKFDVASEATSSKVFAMSPKGFKQFYSFLKKNFSQPWVCMEATGHYSELLAEYLHSQAIRVSIVNPFQIKSFSRSMLARNKNDNLDAKIIADFCQRMEPRVFQPRPKSQVELRELMTLLDTLKVQLVQLKNQLQSTRSMVARDEIKKAINAVEKKIKLLEHKIEKITKEHNSLAEKMNLLSSIKGVGKITSFKILAFLPDISQFEKVKQFTAFIGITPRQFQSGSYQGKTVLSRLGNPAIRKALYMAALVAKRFNPYLQPFVKRLEKRGKAPKAIICAVMRKLAHIIFGVLKHAKPFDPKILQGA